MITRANPEVGYIDEEAFELLGFTQVARAGDTCYLSGIAPFTGKPPQFTVVGTDDMEAQVPTSTWLGTTGLAHPDQLVEITAIACAA